MSSTLGAATNNGLIFLKFGRMVDLLSAHLLVQRSSKTDDYWPRTDLTKLKSPGQNAKINVVQIRENLQCRTLEKLAQLALILKNFRLADTKDFKGGVN